MQGKATDLPPAVLTFMFCAVFGWSIEYVESLSEAKFKQLAPMVQMKYRADCASI